MIKSKVIKSIGLEVPAITFGGASIGNLFKKLSNSESLATVEQAIKTGYRYYDTAPHYGNGLSESRLGLGLRELDRDDYILSTKVGRLLAPRSEPGLEAGDFYFDENPMNRVYDYSYDGIMRSYEDSLQRLGSRKIDLLHVHDVGTYTHGETDAERKHFDDLLTSGFKALQELKDSGDIKGYGVGANEEEILMEIMDHVQPDIFMLANRYNLLETDRNKFFEKCEKNNVSVAVAAPFATGVLVAGSAKNSSIYEYGQVPENIIKRVSEIEAICARYEVPVGAAALQFPLKNSNVVTVTCGIASPEQAITNFKWFSTEVPEALWNDLSEIGIQ